jgi:hypothetical protein
LRLPDVDAGLYAELLEDGEAVERVALDRGVAAEVEVVRVGGPCAHGVEEHDTIVGDEVRHQVLPHGQVRAEAVREHDDASLPRQSNQSPPTDAAAATKTTSLQQLLHPVLPRPPTLAAARQVPKDQVLHVPPPDRSRRYKKLAAAQPDAASFAARAASPAPPSSSCSSSLPPSPPSCTSSSAPARCPSPSPPSPSATSATSPQPHPSSSTLLCARTTAGTGRSVTTTAMEEHHGLLRWRAARDGAVAGVPVAAAERDGVRGGYEGPGHVTHEGSGEAARRQASRAGR